MRRLWAAGAAIVMCLALGGLPVLAQDASPAEGPEAPAAVAAYTSIAMDCVRTVECTMTAEGHTGRATGCLNTCELTADDARVNGVMTVRPECDWADPEVGYLGAACWGTWELVGPDGTWAGALVSAEPTGGWATLVLVAEGTGAYEGWTFVGNLLGWEAGDDTQEGDAFVYQGPLPRWPALPSSADT
jgi:hypothetical protein